MSFLQIRIRACTGTILVTAALLLWAAPALAKRKDDVIVFKNGDRLTGEIKRLERGQLYFKNSSMYASVQLDWAAIDQIISKDRYIVELTTGERLEGYILKGAGAGREDKLVISTARGEIATEQENVIYVRPEEEDFWHQLTGSFDFGFSFAQANDQKTINLATEVRYLTPSFDVKIGGSSNFSQTGGGEQLDRRQGYLQFDKFLAKRKRWYLETYLDLLSSEEQSLKLRTTLGTGIGYRPKLTNRTSWSFLLGTVLNRERFEEATGQPASSEVEGLVGTQFSSFHFTKSELNARFLVFPSYTTPGRVRMDLRTDYRVELVNNLNWKLTFFETFDSAPPPTARKNDLGITVSIGWTF